MLVVAVSLAGCASPQAPPDPTPTTSSTSVVTSDPPEPTTLVPTTDPTTEPLPPAPDPVVGAQDVCEAVYQGRGAAPHAESGDLDDEMALVEVWHAGLLDAALSRLGSAPALADLVAVMQETRDLSARAARIYAQHPTFSEELAAIQQRQEALAEAVGPIATDAGAPACATLVVLP